MLVHNVLITRAPRHTWNLSVNNFRKLHNYPRSRHCQNYPQPTRDNVSTLNTGEISSNYSLSITLAFSTWIIIFKRCFDKVFQRPYRYFSIALKVFFSLSDRYKIFTSNWLWIEICENVVLIKIAITMTTRNKRTFKLIKAEFCVI